MFPVALWGVSLIVREPLKIVLVCLLFGHTSPVSGLVTFLCGDHFSDKQKSGCFSDQFTQSTLEVRWTCRTH